MPTINRNTITLYKSKRKQERQKYYANTQWKELRKLYRQTHPLCEECLEHGIVNATGIQIHHIRSPFDPNIEESERWKRLLSWDNLKSLCAECHGKLHEMEQKSKKIQKNEKKSPK